MEDNCGGLTKLAFCITCAQGSVKDRRGLAVSIQIRWTVSNNETNNGKQTNKNNNKNKANNSKTKQNKKTKPKKRKKKENQLEPDLWRRKEAN